MIITPEPCYAVGMNESMPVEGWHVRLADPRSGRSFSIIHARFPHIGVPPSETAPTQVCVLAGFFCADFALQYADEYEPDDFGGQRATSRWRGNSPESIDAASMRWKGGVRPDARAVVWGTEHAASARPTGRFQWDFVMQREVGWEQARERDDRRDETTGWRMMMLEARVAGTVDLNGYRYDVGGWRGYQEHWWGLRLPEEWLWAQCFFADGSSLAFGASACAVNGGRRRRMAQLGLWDNGRLYIFEREMGDQVEIQQAPNPLVADGTGEGAPIVIGEQLAVEVEDRAGLNHVTLTCGSRAPRGRADRAAEHGGSSGRGPPCDVVRLYDLPCCVERYQRPTRARPYSLVSRLISSSGALVGASGSETAGRATDPGVRRAR